MPRENFIKIRRGSQATISGITLGLGEPGFTTDTKRLYIGDGLGNNLIGPYDDHGMLNGLSDDDHPQYLNISRGDERYYTQAQITTMSGNLQNQINVHANDSTIHFTEASIDKYTQLEVDLLISTTSGTLQNQFDNLGDIYYTETEIDNIFTTTSGSLQNQINNLDHGDLQGLSDDDHPQYILVDGSRGFTNTVSGVDPINDYDLTTKGYAETLILGTGNIYFGTDIEYITDETESSTNSTSWQQKIKLTSTNIESGSYRVGWSFEWRLSNTLGTFYGRVQYDDTQNIFSRTYSSSGDVTIWKPISDFYYLDTVASGVHTFDIDYHSSSTFTTAYIRNARIEFWRVL